MHILTKRGNLDNVITYEHICDTTEDMAFIERKYITLGSTCVVLQGEGGGMEVYMADSNKEWHDIMVTGGNEATPAGLELHVCTSAEVQNGKPKIDTPLESTLYLVPSGAESGNLYDEYVYVNEQWELFGGARVSLDGYATESWVQQQNYLTSVPHASSSAYGTIKLGTGLAPIVDSQGNDNGVGVLLAPNSIIKQGTQTSWAVPVSGTDAAAFYGLAKAAGDTTQAQSSNVIGTYTTAAKTAIQEMLDVPSNDAIPTKVSDLTNDSGFITSFTESDPTVPAWAKAVSKPTYTAAEVGAPTTQEMNSAIATAIGNSLPAPGADGTILVADDGAWTVGTVDNEAPVESGTGIGSIQSKQFTVSINNTDNTFIQSASGEGAIAFGAGANASGFAATAMGVYTIASGECSFAEGDSSEAIGNMSHAEGSSTFASGGASHAEGVGDCIYYEITAHPSTYTYQFENLDEEVQNGWVVYDENSKQVYAIQNRTGDTVTLIGGNNFNVGDTLAFYSNAAYGEASHTEGYNTIALGNYSHAEGKLTKVLYDVEGAHAEGYGTVADAPYLHVDGTFNVYTGRHNYVHITGIGTSNENRANGFTVDNQGNGWFAGTVSAGTSAEPASVNDPNDLTTKQYVDNALAAKVVSVEGTTPEVAADADTQYICGEVSTLSFTPAATGISDIIFESGSTATVLTVPNTVKFPDWFDATALEPNMVYEISIMNGTYGAVMAWATT